jgi:sugar lactone lactonase YvrE
MGWDQTASASIPRAAFGHRPLTPPPTGDDNAPAGAVVRVLDGGEITHRVETDLPCFSCALGGPDGRHLFLLCNEFEGVDQLEAVLSRRSARIYVTDVPF